LLVNVALKRLRISWVNAIFWNNSNAKVENINRILLNMSNYLLKKIRSNLIITV